MNRFASFKTNAASRHLSMLCNHFGRKVVATCDAETGWVQFPFGRCDMSAETHRLEFRASAETEPQLDQVVDVVTRHLERFAFRENPMLVWTAHRDDPDMAR